VGRSADVLLGAGAGSDHDALRDAIAKAREAELRFRNAFEHAPFGKALIDLSTEHGALIESNRALSAISGYGREELLGLSLDEITVAEDRDLDRDDRRRMLTGEQDSYTVEKRLLHKDGHQVWCQVSVSLAPASDAEGKSGIVHVQDISDRRRLEQRLQYLADHDSLTGLINRRRFRSELEQLVSLNKRYGGQGAVLVIDIDDFKRVNDALGHHAGDMVIRRVADLLRERVRTTDIVARLSGDEFAILMPHVDEAGAVQLAEDLRAAVAERAGVDGEAGAVTASIGISIYGRDHKLGAETVLVSADLAMYRAKEDGRNRISLLSGPGEAPQRLYKGQSTSAKLRDALSRNQLTLYQQPILDLVTGQVQRHELLLRMANNGGEPIPAASFIETAERVGMVQELDRWVIVRALELLAAQQRSGHPWAVHVNVSGSSVTDLSVLEYIERHLDEGDADPTQLTFEITESAAIRDFETAASFADRLGEFGCEVAIDDYGAGFAPFYYLKHLPFDLIKIDGEFVRDLASSDADQLTVKAIVGIAHGLGKRTIAEFVQDERTARLLREYGVDMAQGFHLGRPVALAEALK
jgi:diguanylate cyclase (GGDEF)-like protein/PAS domain S-box-containing protein